MISRVSRVLSFVFLLGASLSPWLAADASVVIQGTRVVYPAEGKGKNVQLTNTDPFPNIVQAWMDIDNPESDPQTADAPFLVTPPLARIEPHAGQSLRLQYTGGELPKDRESLFYLNILQIPPRNQALTGQNQMLVMVRNRMKVFYRPDAVTGSAQKAPEQVHFSLSKDAGGWLLTAENPTGYHVNLSSAEVVINGRRFSFKADMIKPFDSARWKMTRAAELPGGTASIEFVFIDDFGAHISRRAEVSR